jgi:hypothetical protein
MPDHLAAFLGVSAIVIATPGPDTALTFRAADPTGQAETSARCLYPPLSLPHQPLEGAR